LPFAPSEPTLTREIAHIEGLPVEEFKQNPYTILMTSEGGGHLGWFEWGGTRWFAKPVLAFLSKMAEDGVEVDKDQMTKRVLASDKPIDEQPPLYQPMRRKLRIHAQE